MILAVVVLDDLVVGSGGFGRGLALFSRDEWVGISIGWDAGFIIDGIVDRGTNDNRNPPRTNDNATLYRVHPTRLGDHALPPGNLRS
jgi:hypothetical protein